LFKGAVILPFRPVRVGLLPGNHLN